MGFKNGKDEGKAARAKKRRMFSEDEWALLSPVIDGQEPQLMELPVEVLNIDWSYQTRTRDRIRDQIRDDFHPALLDVLIISQRPDKQYFVADGATRVLALLQRGEKHRLLRCLVYQTIGQPVEALLFLWFNSKRSHAPIELQNILNAAHVAGTDGGFGKAIEDCGYVLIGGGKRHLHGPGYVWKAWNLDGDGTAMKSTLRALKACWKDNFKIYGYMVLGIARIYHFSRKTVDDQIRRLLAKKTPDEIMQMVTRKWALAGNKARVHPDDKPRIISRVIAEAINRNPGKSGKIDITRLESDARVGACIGELYQRAQSSNDGRVFYFADAGNCLLRKKESLGHGQWLTWLETNQGALGFGHRGARSLIQGAQWLASNWQLANTLEEIVTNPNATCQDLAKAEEIRRLVGGQFRPAVRGTFGRRRNEWYTPREYIRLARQVLGDIEFDPASSELAQETVKAREYFDKSQNGLQRPWHGRVWLNPPYSQPLIGKFILKLLMEWNAGRIAACIALTHNYTDAIWFHDAVSAANVICFTQGRVRFYEPGGGLAKPTQGQAFFYFGSEVDAFKREFGRVGFLVRPEPDQSWQRRRVRDEAAI